MGISEYLGINLDYAVIGIIALMVLVLILIIIMIVHTVQMKKLKKNYRIFMEGKDAKTLEDTLIKRLDQVDNLIEANEKNADNIDKIFHDMKFTFQKVGLVKYDAFHQMGGQLSFSLAILDENNNGFIINSVHSTEGCYSYTKEIKEGKSSISLGTEEAEALSIALGE